MTNKDEALKALRFISDNTVSYPNPYKQAEGLEEAFHIIERALTEAPKVDELISEVRNCPAIKDQMNISDQSRTAVNIALSRAIDHLTTHYDLVKKERRE